MITTKQVSVNLTRGRKLERKTTKDIDASIPVGIPTTKPTFISTRMMGDVADMAEKKRRDEIMASRKAIREVKADGRHLEKLNMQNVFVEFDGLIQAVSRRELK